MGWLQQYLPQLFGGVLIGCAASLLLLFQGRVFGISGILANGIFSVSEDRQWQIAVIVGLLFSGLVLRFFYPDSLILGLRHSPLRYLLSGLLVGIGTQLGSGCTSGHGVCGMSRLSIRSIVATVCFITAGVATVALVGR